MCKWCINVSSVGTLIPANDFDFDAPSSSDEAVARSVAERRIERWRPSGNRTTTKAVRVAPAIFLASLPVMISISAPELNTISCFLRNTNNS